MGARLAFLIATLLLSAGCIRARSAAGAREGCGACHAPHYAEQGACEGCHRGNPAAARKALAHARLLTGRAAAHGLSGGAAVREGRALAESAACRRCHAISGSGNRLATKLDSVGWQREQAELLASITAPVENMPNFGFDRRQAEALIAFLLHGASVQALEGAYRVHFVRGSAAAPSLFDEKCGGCHRLLSGLGPQGTGTAGPNLSGLFTPFYPKTAPGERAWTAEALARWTLNPRATRSTTTMPPVPLSVPELRQVTELFAEAQGRAYPGDVR